MACLPRAATMAALSGDAGETVMVYGLWDMPPVRDHCVAKAVKK
jgi:hypothetical protein